MAYRGKDKEYIYKNIVGIFGRVYAEYFYLTFLKPVFKGCVRSKLPYTVIEEQDFRIAMLNVFRGFACSDAFYPSAKSHSIAETLYLFILNIKLHKTYKDKGVDVKTVDKSEFKYISLSVI